MSVHESGGVVDPSVPVTVRVDVRPACRQNAILKTFTENGDLRPAGEREHGQ